MRRTACIFLLLAGHLAAQTDVPSEPDMRSAAAELPPLAPVTADKNGKLALMFVGASAFPQARLREALARQVESVQSFGLDEPGAYDMAYFLESFYRSEGFTGVQVESQILAPWRLELRIQEGAQAHVGTVRILGNKHFDETKILKYLLGPLRKRYPQVRGINALPFAEADIDTGADLVRRLYAAEGYLEADIPPPDLSLSASETTGDIRLEITEGPAYRFGTIRIDGPVGSMRDAMKAVVKSETQGVYTDGRIATATRALEDFLARRGYFTATVESESDPSAAAPSSVPVTFVISPGPIFRFDGVRVSGADGVRPAFIEKRLSHLGGKTYSPDLVDQGFRELIQTGLFKNLRIQPRKISGNEIRLEVEVEEAKPKEFGFGVGYATFYGGMASLSYQDRNFLRSGRPFHLQLEANQRGYAGEVLYRDPWFLDSPYEFKGRLYALNSVLKGYSKNEIGITPSLSRQWTRNWKLTGFLSAREKQIFDVEIDPASLVGSENYPVFSAGITQALDYRNNVAIPTSGFILSSAFELAALGEVSYLRGTGQFSWYLPMTAKSTLSLGARAGVVAPLNGSQLPIDERFFNGGATTVRSFSELSLGPRDHAGYPLGGEVFTVFNAEYSFQIVGDLYLAVFTDAGNVLPTASEFGLQDLRYAIGAGLRYHLPIGAIRLDYGLNPDPRDGEAQGAFHFAIGVAF